MPEAQQAQGHERSRDEREQRAQLPVRQAHRRGLYGVAHLVQLPRELRERDDDADEGGDHENAQQTDTAAQEHGREGQDVDGGVPEHEQARRRGARLQPHCGLRSDKTLPEAQRDAEDGNGREDGQRRVQFLRAYGRGAEAEG